MPQARKSTRTAPRQTPSEARALFSTNIRLAYKCAHRWLAQLGPILEAEDVIQLALLGLWKACLHWDSRLGRLATLAYWAIGNEIRCALRQRGKSPPSVPWGDTRQMERLYYAMERLYYAEDKNAVDPERAALLSEALHSLPREARAFAPYSPGEAASLHGSVALHEVAAYRRQALAALKQALAGES